LISLDAHPDRTLGARALECPIIAHKESADVFRSRSTIFKGQGEERGGIWEIYGEAIGMRWVSPDITFSRRMSLHWGVPEIVLLHQPGPTPGSIWVVIPDCKIVFVGDAISPNQPPFLANADLDTWIECIDLLLDSYRDYEIVSGRGGLVIEDDIRFQRRFLIKVIKGMERFVRRKALPEDAESLAPRLLSDYKVGRELKDQFEQRLRHGLNQCYANRYQVIVDPTIEDSRPYAR
jgi:glyoxylase-like metal-dependent hydrolase (beta-lactamase superfamily II)